MTGSVKPTLRLEGPLRLTSGGGVDVTPRGKRSKALLAMLALAPKRTRSRKWLQDKLWSDRGATQAAASLRQELSGLRKHFRNIDLNVLAIDREVVSLDPGGESLYIDHIGNGERPQDLLEGIDLADPEFEDWLRDERTHWLARQEARAQSATRVDIIEPGAPAGRLTGTRPCIGLLRAADGHSDPPADVAADLFIDLVARSILSFDVADVIDLRFSKGFRPTPTGIGGPDWILQTRVSAQGNDINLSVTLRAVEDNRILWSQLRRSNAGTFFDTEQLELGAFVNEVVSVALDQVLSSCHPWDEGRHEAARLALGAIYRMFRLEDKDLDAAEHGLLTAYELEGRSTYLGWLLFINVMRLGERRLARNADFDDTIRDLARRALEADAHNPITLALTAHAHSFIFRDYAYALELANRAVDANPMLALCRDLRALTLGYIGDVKRGYADALRARQLGGPLPYRFCIDTTCCIMSALNERFEEGIRFGQQALTQQPRYLPALRYTASCQGHLGQTSAAVATLSRLRELEPDFTPQLITREDYPLVGDLGVDIVMKGLSRLSIPADAP